MSPISKNGIKNQGFALVVTVSLLVLLSVIALGFLTLSTVTLRSGTQNQAQLEARANARLALQVAIGELQKQLGPDQRISANGAITSTGSVLHPHWTGVWDSWIAGNPAQAPVLDPNKYPSGTSHHSTIGSQPDDSMRPKYGDKDKHFRAWLLSLDPDESTDPSAPAKVALTGVAMPSENENAVRLVGPGSLGDDAPTTDHVSARLIKVQASTSSNAGPDGRYAWWVGDQSQKARVMHDDYHGETLTSADKIFRAQAPASTGTTTIPGLEDISDDEQARLEWLPSLSTLDLVPGVKSVNDGGTFRASQKGFHAITPFSRSVLADVREGGLKRDLSTLLERTLDPAERSDEFMLYKFNVKDAWANDPGLYPTLPNTPQECVPIQDLAAFYQLYDQSRKAGIKYNSLALKNTIQLSNPDYGTASQTDLVNGWRGKFLKEYTTLYRNPVPIKVQFLVSIHAEPITPQDRLAKWSTYLVNTYVPTTDTHKLRFAIIPAVTMWNPYNVPIVMESGASRSQQIVMKTPPLSIKIKKLCADGTTTEMDLALDGIVCDRWAGGRGELLKLNFARTAPLIFQPGEVRVFSASTSSPYFMAQGQMYHDNQGLNSGKNLVDAGPGWNPNSILTARLSATGYTIAAHHNNPTGAYLVKLRNYFYEPDALGASARWSFTMNPNSSDKFEFTVGRDTATSTWPMTAGCSPVGSAISLYMAQRLFSAFGDGSGKGYNFVSMRHFSLVSRFGGGGNGFPRAENNLKCPSAFNEQFIDQASTSINFFTPMEPITAENIVAASNAGESIPFIQLALMAGCETSEMANGGLVSGRKFPSRPFLHSSPIQPNVIDKLDGTAPYNHGWNWWVDEMNSILESMVQESKGGNGYYGGGFTAESGTTRVVQQEIPVTPPISIAALSHARLGGFTLASELPVAEGYGGTHGEGIDGNQTMNDNPSPTLGFQRTTATGQGGLFPHILQAIGNSYANPNLAPGVAYDPAWKRLYDQDDGERNVVFADHSYLANKALWDDYFFSSITPQTATTIEVFRRTPTDAGRDAKKVASDFFGFTSTKEVPLPNRRIVPYTANLTNSTLDALFNAKNTYSGGLADKIASHLMVEGAFNINSTSVEAWKVFFSSLKGKPIAYLDGGKVPKEAAVGNNVPISMATLPNGEPAATADTEDPRDPAQWKGLRSISDEEIDALAQAMVREVKKRGPFLSLSEFINRRLDPNNTDGTALKGALQAALDYDGGDGAGPEVTINKNFRDSSRTLDNEISGISYAFQDAAKGPAAYGSSAYVDQADVLRHLAEQITPRGDTFVIRTYGDSLDAEGKVVARAWCEAIVQRIPGYVDKTDENHLKTSDLQSDANKRFGRTFQMISFRWLNSSDV